MTTSAAYPLKTFPGRMLEIASKYLYRFLLFFFILIPFNLFSQEQTDYDEISVFLEVPRIGGTEIVSVIKGDILYLPVTDLFDFLKIKNIPTPGLESVSGFFINPSATYTISRTENLIRYQDKTFNLQPGDLIRTESNLYLKASYFGKVFGLDCIFNFRALSVSVNSKLELPMIREMRQEEMRRNLTRLKGEIKADTNIARSYPLFKFGMADWSAIAAEEIKGRSETRLNLNLGGIVAGGETTIGLNYNSASPFTEKQQYYLWRRVDNDFKPLRQVMAGKIPTNAISSIYNPVVGIQFTNTPTTFRRSFGTYMLSDKTEPGWIVELYVNNVLVDYVKADASGFFTFQVPLVYGNSSVRLKFFGPWGEEHIKEQNITIPFNFLPRNTFEYYVSAGIVEDSSMSRFSKANVNYGVTRSFTLGGGVEYLSSVKSGPAMPYLNASVRVTNNLLLTGEYTYGVRAKGTLSYRMPSNLQLDLNYTKYDKGQKAINYNYLEERKAALSVPLRIGKFSSFQRFSYYQIVLPATSYSTGEWLFSGSLAGISTSLTTYALFFGNTKPNVYSNMSLAFRLPAGLVIMPSAQYTYTQNKLLSAKISLEKHLLEHGFLNFSLEENRASNMRMAELGFRYDFAFAQTGASVRQSDKRTTLIQYARGSLIYDRKTKYLGADNRTNVGKGGISVIPYIDLNANGIRDAGEPKAFGLNLRANGGHVERSERDTTIRILGLEPYTTCFIELDANSFDNVTWKLPVRSLSVAVDPNMLKHIEIPVTVVGEATGNVSLDINGERSGLGRIIIVFYNSNHKLIGKTLTEDDGYYSYMGLTPGSYIARADTSHLRKLGLRSDPESLQFKISSGTEGDVADNLNFTLYKLAKPAIDTVVQKVPEKPVIRKDTSRIVVHAITQELVTITEDSYAIQLGAFKKKSNAEALRLKLTKLLGRKVDIIVEGGFYKVRINGIKERKDADATIAVLEKNGIKELWLISLKAKQQQWVITDKQDTVTKITETIVSKPEPVITPDMSMQVGAFRQQAYAQALQKKLASYLSKPVVIVQEDGFYKVRISGFKNMVEIDKILPALGLYGLNDIWVLPVKKQPEQPPAAVVSDTSRKIVEVKKEPVVTLADTGKAVEVKKDTSTVKPKPTIALMVNRYYKKSQAIKAQRKITKKLKLQVEIVPQWEYYNVIITGFFTPEETYKYYPELAGLGFTVRWIDWNQEDK
jgi:cell division protein FtsN